MIKEFNHQESRDKGQDLAPDQPGYFNGEISKAAHGSFTEATSPKQYEVERFEKMVDQHIEKDYTDLKVEELLEKI